MRVKLRNQYAQNSHYRLWLRLGTVSLVFVGIAINEIFLRGWLLRLPSGTWIALDSLLLVMVGTVAYIFIDRLLSWREERRELNQRLEAAELAVAEANQRQATVFKISQMFSEASEEHEVVELILQLSRELVGALGASFVSLDEREQPLPAMTVGEMPLPAAEAWLEYLATPAVRRECSACKNLGQINLECTLLRGAFQDNVGIYCLPLRRATREYGILNLYIPEPNKLNHDEQAFLRKIVDETTLALEGLRLRKRELATLHQLQAVRRRTDLNSSLTNLLLNLNETLEADYALITVWDGSPEQSQKTITHGELNTHNQPLVNGILQTVMSSQEPVLIGDVAGDGRFSPGLRALMAAPLLSPDNQSEGVLLVTSNQAKAFSQRQLSVLETVAGQVALVIKNVNLIAELEFKTVMEERTRLAREIHDGLAQTLGFLKLKASQMKNYLEIGDQDHLRETISVCYHTLDAAYQDARQAIDGLRLSANYEGISGWLRNTANEYQENSGVMVQLAEPIEGDDLPPEVHAQLIRVVQEALNNIRKHSKAKTVWISSRIFADDLILEVRDDGQGFDADDVPEISRYGLRGMRERAELIGADFQVIARPDEGTTVRVRLPFALVGGRKL